MTYIFAYDKIIKTIEGGKKENYMSFFEKMIPQPKSFSENEGVEYSYSPDISGDFESSIRVFKAYAKKAYNIEFGEGESIKVCLDESLSDGEYTICAGKEGIIIKAGASEGAGYALATLLQIIEKRENKIFLPFCEIYDKADNDYRGLMIDCARNAHPLPLLKKYIDACWFYKIKYFHLHFTDNEAYTLPSKVLPMLTSEENHYTEDEIADLVSYAEKRGVQIVPEIDLPGHSKAIIRAYPQLGGTEENSIICFHPENVEKMKELYAEVCKMFPHSEYIHIGADESDIMQWHTCPRCIEYGRELGIKKEEVAPYFWPDWHVVERFFAHFVNEMASTIVENGRKPLVWEGFTKEVNEYLTRDITVMVFENFYQTPTSLMKNGFDIINCSWRPTYVVVPTYHWDKRECYDWDVGTFSAVHPDSPYYNGYFKFEGREKIMGGQLNAWGDFLGKLENGLKIEFDALLDRLPAIAESTWNDKKAGNFDSFLRCHSHCAEIFDRIVNDAQ